VKTEDLIANISREISPRRVLPPAAALGCWLFVSLGSAVVGAWCLGLRTDFVSLGGSRRYVAEGFLLVSLLVVAGSVSVLLAYPGRFLSRLVLPLLGTFIGAWMGALCGFLLLDLKRGPIISAGWGADCLMSIVMVSVLPAVTLFALARRAAPTHLMLNALCIGVAAFAVGALGLHFHCAVEGALHRFVWHAAPLVAVGGISAFAGWRLLRW